jgi:hypothetical protein
VALSARTRSRRFTSFYIAVRHEANRRRGSVPEAVVASSTISPDKLPAIPLTAILRKLPRSRREPVHDVGVQVRGVRGLRGHPPRGMAWAAITIDDGA